MKNSPSIHFPRQHREIGKSGEIDIVKFQKTTKEKKKMKNKPKFEWYLTIYWIFCLSKLSANYQLFYCMSDRLARIFYIYQHSCCELGKQILRPWSPIECDKQKWWNLWFALFSGPPVKIMVKGLTWLWECRKMMVFMQFFSHQEPLFVGYCWKSRVKVIFLFEHWSFRSQQLQIYSFEYHLN